MNATQEIANLLPWGEPKQIRTSRGERNLRTAEPTPMFWNLWRSSKEELKAAGVSVDKRDGNWQVCWWQSISVTQDRKASNGPRLESDPTTLLESDPDNQKAAPRRSDNVSEPVASSLVSQATESIFGKKAAGVEMTPQPVVGLPPGVVLSNEQIAIHEWIANGEGNCEVVARAGTGKTTTITWGISRAKEQDILYLVFNKKNEVEAKAKILDPRVTIRTLNAFGFRCCGSVWRGVKPDDAVERERIESVCKNIPDEAAGAVERLVGFAKNLFVAVPSVAELIVTANERGIFCGLQTQEGDDEFPVVRLANIAQAAMEAAKVKDPANRISFNDQVWLAVTMGWVRPSADLIFTDECFPAGTKVKMSDGTLKAIESISVGDEVANAVGSGVVTKKWKRFTKALVRVIHQKGSFVCTPNHPVLTNKGWIKACFLSESHHIIGHEEAMRLVQGNFQHPFKQKDSEAAILQSILCGEMEAEPARDSGKGLYSGSRKENFIEQESSLCRQSQSGSRHFVTDDSKESDAQPVNKAKGKPHSCSNGAQAARTRRQWNRPDQGRTSSVVSFSGGDKQSCSQNESRSRISSPLQNRRSVSSFEDCSGMRREISLWKTEQGEGSKERTEAQRIGVVRVEVFKSCDLGTDRTSSIGTEVYNLAVSAHPSYVLENGEVVHNCQDMNLPQLVMVQRAVRKGGRVCVVGDDRQCIYTFRGAHPDGMGVMRDALQAKVLGLTKTRRCPKCVVRRVKSIVPDYEATEDAPEGEELHVNEQELLDRLQIGDAVLSRANAPLMPLCLALLRKGVPARIEGRDIGKRLVGIVNRFKAKSVPDFLRRLDAWVAKQAKRLDIGKEGKARMASVMDEAETLRAVAEGCANVFEVTNRIKELFQNSDDEGVKPAVVLSSTHKAKGLEWQRIALLTWTFNKRWKNQSSAQVREEQNLWYVAQTRTKFTTMFVTEGGRGKVKDNADGTKEGAI